MRYLQFRSEGRGLTLSHGAAAWLKMNENKMLKKI